MKINVLGTDYEIEYREQHEDKVLKSADGYCDTSIKKIVVDTMKSTESEDDAKKDLKSHGKKVLRHELVHAFLSESGLNECSWGNNEEAVDWIAVQFPKMLKAFRDAGGL